MEKTATSCRTNPLNLVILSEVQGRFGQWVKRKSTLRTTKAPPGGYRRHGYLRDSTIPLSNRKRFPQHEMVSLMNDRSLLNKATVARGGCFWLLTFVVGSGSLARVTPRFLRAFELFFNFRQLSMLIRNGVVSYAATE